MGRGGGKGGGGRASTDAPSSSGSLGFSTERHNQAIDIIAKEISKIPANKPAVNKGDRTEREVEAKSMARWFIENVDGIKINWNEGLTPGTKEAARIRRVFGEVNRMADVALKRVGK